MTGLPNLKDARRRAPFRDRGGTVGIPQLQCHRTLRMRVNMWAAVAAISP